MQFLVSTITNSAIDLTDQRNSQFIDQSGAAGSELIRFANMAFRDVYQQIIMVKEHYFTTSTNFAVTSQVTSYPLPADFYKLDGVDLYLDDSGKFFTLTPFTFKERNKFRGSSISIAAYGPLYKYFLIGNNIQFVPVPSQASKIQLWYTPEPPVITSLSDTISLPIGCDEYMSLYIAGAIKVKEEEDNSQLNAKRLEVLDQLKNSLRERDSGSPSYVIDESTINEGALYPWTLRG